MVALKYKVLSVILVVLLQELLAHYLNLHVDWFLQPDTTLTAVKFVWEALARCSISLVATGTCIHSEALYVKAHKNMCRQLQS